MSSCRRVKKRPFARYTQSSIRNLCGVVRCSRIEMRFGGDDMTSESRAPSRESRSGADAKAVSICTTYELTALAPVWGAPCVAIY